MLYGRYPSISPSTWKWIETAVCSEQLLSFAKDSLFVTSYGAIHFSRSKAMHSNMIVYHTVLGCPEAG